MPSGRLIEAAAKTDMSLSAELTTPSDWDDHYKQALRHSAPFLKIKVDTASREFVVLKDFIGPACDLKEVHRVVNPALWRRFLATRKELICAKSNDVSVLGSLGMENDELINRASQQLNPQLAGYRDNVALLFHCTRTGSVDAILSQGLDDRLARGGSYGRGIYFADDPALALHYDGTGGTLFIFAVHLGDCCPVTAGTIIREPEKAKTEKRTQMDLFFDSIVAGPSNQYVIFSRHQCYPLYVASFVRAGGSRKPGSDYSAVRRKLPPFMWIDRNQPWPFFAKVIFTEMCTPKPQTPQLQPTAKSRVDDLGEENVREKYEWIVPIQPLWWKKNIVGQESLPTPVFQRGTLSDPIWKTGFKSNLTNQRILVDFVLPTSKGWSVESFDVEFLGERLQPLKSIAMNLAPVFSSIDHPQQTSSMTSASVALGGRDKITQMVKAFKFLLVIEGEGKGKALPAEIVEIEGNNDHVNENKSEESLEDEVKQRVPLQEEEKVEGLLLQKTEEDAINTVEDLQPPPKKLKADKKNSKRGGCEIV